MSVFICVCVWEWERRGEWREFGESWFMGRHMARLAFLSVFCLCLRASCLSQAGVLLKQDHSCGTGRERGRRGSFRGRTTDCDCGKPYTFPFHLHNLLSPCSYPLPASSCLHLNCATGKSSTLQLSPLCAFTQTQRINWFSHITHYISQKKITVQI